MTPAAPATTPRWLAEPFVKLGLAILGFFLALAVAHPFILGSLWATGVYNPLTGYDDKIPHPSGPTADHLLGTDPLGRDVASMIMEGAKPALAVAAASVLASFVVSVVIAALSTVGRVGRWTAWAVSNTALLLPAPIVMAILGSSALGDFFTAPVFGLMFGALAGASSAGLVVRSRTLDLAVSGFIEAAVVAGTPPLRRFRRELLPHLIPLATVYAFLAASAAIITDGFLAFLGLVETRFNWGTIVDFALTFRTLDGRIPWNVLVSTGTALSLLTLGSFLIATGLRRWDSIRHRENYDQLNTA